MMSLIHILNNYHDPFPHLKGRGGLQFHPSRHIIGGALSNELAIKQISDLLAQVEQPTEQSPVDTTEEDEIKERLEQYEQSQSQQASEPEPEKTKKTKSVKKDDPQQKKAQEKLNLLSEEFKLISKGKTKLGEIQSICQKYGIETKKTRSSDGKVVDKTKDDLINNFKDYITSLKPKTPISEQDQNFYNTFEENLIKIQKLVKEIQSTVGVPVLSKSVNDYLDKVLSEIKNVKTSAKAQIDRGEYPKTVRIMETLKTVIAKIKTMKGEITEEKKVDLYKEQDEKKHDHLQDVLLKPILSMMEKLDKSESLTKLELEYLQQTKNTVDQNELTPTNYPKTTALINLIKEAVDSTFQLLDDKAKKSSTLVSSEEDIAEQKRLKREAKRAMVEANIAKSKLVEKPETLSLPEPEIEKALVKVENPKIVKMIDNALDQLIEGLITKSARDTINKMDKLFTDISVVKGHGKSFENILCNTDFKYVLQSITGSQTPILNNDENPKLKGHMAKYKIQGQSLPLGSVCVYDLYDEKASYECKNYFGTKSWPEGETYYGNTTGITMQTDKFEGNYNFKPYFNKVNGQWKLYNVLVEYSHDLNEEGKPKNKWLYKNYNTDLIFIVLCKDALVYYNLTDDLETYAYKINTKGYEGKNKEELYEITISDTIKLGVVNPKKDGEIFIPTNKFKPIIPI